MAGTARNPPWTSEIGRTDVTHYILIQDQLLQGHMHMIEIIGV